MDYKYTSDGRKVVVIGALNSKEIIVQEVYVCDGSEIPAGEHFVVKTLLDKPCETYKAKEEKRLELHIEKLESERNKLSLEIHKFNTKLLAATAKLKWVQGITEPELRNALDRIMAFLNGEITHILFYKYDLEIQEVGCDAFARYENDYGNLRFDGIRLISLFGEWNGRLKMDWRINAYRDGSGYNQEFIPCKSLSEAIEAATQIINAKNYLCDKDYDFCLKYGVPVDEIKNAERIRKKRDDKEEAIAKAREQIARMEAELLDIK